MLIAKEIEVKIKLLLYKWVAIELTVETQQKIIPAIKKVIII